MTVNFHFGERFPEHPFSVVVYAVWTPCGRRVDVVWTPCGRRVDVVWTEGQINRAKKQHKTKKTRKNPRKKHKTTIMMRFQISTD